MPITGWYRIRVSPTEDGGDPRERGAYRFALVPFDANPETAARQVTLGDSVSSVCPGRALRLVVYDTTTQDSLGPVTGAVLVGQVLSLIGSTSQLLTRSV